MLSKATVICIGACESLYSQISSLEDCADLYYAQTDDSAERILDQQWVQVAIVAYEDTTENVDALQRLHLEHPDIRLIVLGKTRSLIIPELERSIRQNQRNRVATSEFSKVTEDVLPLITFLDLPINIEVLKQSLLQNIEWFKVLRENQQMRLELSIRPKKYADEVAHQRKYLQAQSDWDQGIVRSSSSSMNQVCEMIEHVGPFDVNVIFTGESGSGKELCAKALHSNSLRRHGPFIAENCGALPDELLASELFGHKKGAFTGATSDNKGLFELADGGTLFLDEVGELSPSFQVKLLRVLQEGEIRPVGSNHYKSVDVRIVAATNRDLALDVKNGKFREDLYYRLATFVIPLPALRDRQGDIATISQVLLQDCMNVLKKRVKGFAQSTLLAMQQYNWPGNIRELQNEIKRMLVLSSEDYLTPNLLSAHIQVQATLDDKQNVSRFITIDNSIQRQTETTDIHVNQAMLTGSLKDRVESLEAKILRETLQRHRWNKTRAANELGLSRVGLRNKLERYELSDALNIKDGNVGKQPSKSSRNMKS